MKISKKNIEAIIFIAFISMLFLSLVFNFFVWHRVDSELVQTDEKKTFQQKLDTEIYNSIIKKSAYNAYFGAAQRIMGKRILSDSAYGEIYKTKYNQMAYAILPDDKMNEHLQKMYILNDELKKEGIPLLFVQAPYKLPEGENQLPENRKNYSNENMDYFLSQLKKHAIDTFDLRNVVYENGKTQNEVFYNTDHHWRIETAFDATWEIAKYLNQKYGFQIDVPKYSNINNYRLETEKQCYLGSQGRRVGRFYAGLDDFTYIIPKFKTDYVLRQYDEAEPDIFKGNFYDAILDKSYMPKDKKDFTINRYAAYHGDNRELIFENKLENQGNIMMIKDSFGIPVYSFLSLGVKEVRAIDLRLFKSSVTDYIKTVKPQVVIVLYNGGNVGDEMYNFRGE